MFYSKILSLYKMINRRGVIVAISAIMNESRILFSKIIKNKYLVKKINNYKMILDVDDKGLSRTLLLFGQRELEHKYMLESYLKPGMSVLDIGANIGYYALLELKLIGKEGSLIAVEPSSENIKLLKKNLKLNQYNDIEVHEAAISDENGFAEIYMSKMSNLNTFHNQGSGTEFLTGEKRKVKTMTVPEVLKGRKIDLIRMDVEGHEIEVINGMMSKIDKNELSPMIIFETHISRYNVDHSIKKVINKLCDNNYEIEMVGTSSVSGSLLLEDLGYINEKTFITDEVERSIFKNIKKEDAINMLSNIGGIRTILLKKNSS